MQLHVHANPLTLNQKLYAEARQNKVLMHPPHYTLNQLMDRLYDSEGMPLEGWAKLPVIGKPFREMIVHRAIVEAQGNPSNPPSPGVVEEIVDTLQELAQAGLEPADVKTILDKNSSSLPPQLTRKLETLYQTFQNQHSLLAKARLLDLPSRDLQVLKFLIAHFQRGTRPQLLEGVETVVVHDVYFLSVVQYGIVSLLMRLAPNGGIVVNFTDSANVEATRFIDFTWQRFVNDENLAESAIPEFVSSPGKPGVLGRLRDRIFSTRWKKEDTLVPDNTFQILAAPDSYHEVEELCRQIRKYLESGVPAHQIAIVSKNLPNYAETLIEVTARYRIPLDFGRGIPLFRLPIIKTIFKLLGLAGSEFRREEFLSVLTSVYLRPENWSSENIIGWVNDSGYLDEQHGKLEDLLSRISQEESRSAPEKIAELAARVKSLKERLQALATSFRTFAEFATLTRGLLIDLGFFQKVVALSDTPLPVVYRDREALQTLLSTLDEAGLLLQSLGEGPVSFRAFLKQAAEILTGVALSPRMSTSHAIQLLSPVQALGLRFDFVFLLGLSEGEFPRLIWESALLKDQDRLELNPVLASVLSEKFENVLEHVTLKKALLTSFEKSRQEPLQFFALLECAQKRLTCSYPQRDQEGKTVLPSVYVGEILRHFRVTSPENSVVCKISPGLYGKNWFNVCDRRDLLKVVAKGWVSGPGHLKPVQKNSSPVFNLFRSQGLDLERLRRLVLIERGRKAHLMGLSQEASQFKNYYADLNDSSSLSAALNLQKRKWSAAEFEAMAACPFAYFAKYFLGLERRRSPDYDPRPWALGPLVRQVLEQFHSRSLSGNPDQEHQRMHSLLSRAFETWERNFPTWNLGYWEIRKAEVQDALEDYARYASTSARDEFQNFSPKLEPSTVLPIGNIHLQEEGRPFRVLIRENEGKVNSIEVTDFKYSDDRTRFRRLTQPENFGQTSFQLPLYLYSIWRQLLEQGREMSPQLRLFGRYILLRQPDQKECRFEARPEMFDSSSHSRVLSGVEHLIDRIKQGRFHPEPLHNICETCNYAALCRFWTSGAGKALKGRKEVEEE